MTSTHLRELYRNCGADNSLGRVAMAEKKDSPVTKKVNRSSGFTKKLFRRSTHGKKERKEAPVEPPKRGFDLDSIPLDGLGMSSVDPKDRTYQVVVAIDFGTTYSGYAYSLMSTPDDIYLMNRGQVGQFGALTYKIPTILLLDEHGVFHSFGFEARETYHDLEEAESRKWLYFEKFKMELHSRKVTQFLHAEVKVGGAGRVAQTIDFGCITITNAGTEQENGT